MVVPFYWGSLPVVGPSATIALEVNLMGEDLETIKERYKDEWMLVEILEEEEDGTPKRVKLIRHSKNRDETYEALRKHKDRRLYHFYNGEIPQEGYAVAFHG